MTPEQFIAIWKDNKLTERGGAQAHFDDLCDLLGVDKPRDPDNLLGELGSEYVEKLRRCYEGRVPGGADLVTYWFEKARAQLAAGQATAAGFVATNSIRGGSNRTVLQRICESGCIFNAWGDEPWINDGAAVRVSLVCFVGAGFKPAPTLNGLPSPKSMLT